MVTRSKKTGVTSLSKTMSMARSYDDFHKVFLISFGLFISFSLAMLIWFESISNDRLEQLELAQLLRLSQTISLDLYSLNDKSPDRLNLWCDRWSKRSKHNITLLNSAGRLIAGQETSGAHDFLTHHDVVLAMKQGFGTSTTIVSGRRQLTSSLKVSFKSEAPLIMRLQRSPFWEQPELDASHREFRWALFFTVLAMGIALWFHSKNITRPHREIQRLTEHVVGQGEDLDLNPRDYLELSGLVKRMNDRFLLHQQKRLISTQERKHHEAILAGMKEGLIALDAEGKISEINRSAKSLLNIRDFKIKGRFLGEILRSNELNQHQQKLTQNGQDFEIESVVNKGTGQEMIFQVSGYLTRKSDGNHHSLMVFTDITRLRKLENMRQGFVANVSHELKTPLTSISGYTEILLDDPDCQDPMTQRFLKRIDHNAKRLTLIIEDLLSLSRLEHKGLSDRDKEKLLVPQFFERLKKDFSSDDLKRVTFHDPQQNKVWAHGLLLHQALFNLIDNALKYSGESTAISVKVKKDKTNMRLCFEVSDNGVGIAQEHLAHLTQRFYRADKDRSREKGGSGLGLSIVKHITEAHGGHIEIESVVGTGSTFRLFFPKT